MLGRSPETEVLRLLYASAAEAGVEAWHPFLSALAELTRAQGALLRIEAAGLHEAHVGAPAPLPPPETLRPLRRDRVYAQEELGTPAPMRLIRLSPRPDAQAWLVLSHPLRDFRAVDAAQLDRLTVHLAQAVKTWLTLARDRAMAKESARLAAALGAGWLWLEATGRVVEADATARALLGPRLAPSGRLDLGDPLLTRAFRRALDQAVTGTETPGIVTLSRAPLTQLALHPGLKSPAPGLDPLIRAGVRQAPPAATLDVTALARSLDLNRSETALAVLLCDGLTLAEAAERLGWTLETARSASKRIYARSGTSGQSALIRRMLTGGDWLIRPPV